MNNTNMTKGQLEADISKALTQWEKEYLGRGPLQVKTDILRNLIIVQLKGILTPAEKSVATTASGISSVKSIRSELIESGSDQLKELITNLTGISTNSFHTDISTITGERIIIFTMEEQLEQKLNI
ncbi:DUF2294 domain-containing protein [Halalkalibacter urbisdiaboli]|uniref:DUF2294 domain-containing protein n=1 Tax=Halalkalibacter urbisdiaboli TaxID=1960589 RepID=UPI001FD8C853|nr:DUF2294 domain-containing protein [Halalkalibacter urbisdiaboli]